MNNKLKVSMWAAILLIVAIIEVATTGALVDHFGVWRLIGLYIVTTSIGLLVFCYYQNRQKKIMEKMRSMDTDSFPDEIKEGLKSPRAMYFGELGMALGTYWLALVLILIPGLVTDALGFIALARWAASRTVRQFDFSYEPNEL